MLDSYFCINYELVVSMSALCLAPALQQVHMPGRSGCNDLQTSVTSHCHRC